MNIKDLEENFKELQRYSDGQFHTIHELQKDNVKLRAENNSLQEMLTGTLPSLYSNNIGISNEQLVCETQIHLLKDVAITRQLNADETKRFCSFVDTLEKIRKTGKDEDMSLRKLSDIDILKLVTNNDKPVG